MLARRSLLPYSLSPLISAPSRGGSRDESALASTLLVLTEIRRSCPPASPLESACTNDASVTPLESALTKKVGGPSMTCLRLSRSAPRPFLPPTISRILPVFRTLRTLLVTTGGGVYTHPFPLRNSAVPLHSPNAALRRVRLATRSNAVLSVRRHHRQVEEARFTSRVVHPLRGFHVVLRLGEENVWHKRLRVPVV